MRRGCWTGGRSWSSCGRGTPWWVWRLDRLGRSLRHLIEVVTGLDERGAGFRSLRESIDTTTAGGRLVFHLFGALAQFEREIIRDRTVAGLAAARARGRVGGRPFKLSAEQVRQARKMYDARELTVEQIGAVLRVSRTSIYRALGTTTTPAAQAAPAPAPATPAATIKKVGGVAAAAPPVQQQTSPDGAPVVARSRGRSRWFVGAGRPGRSRARAGGGAQRPHQPEGGDDRAGPGTEPGSVGRGGGSAAAGPRRRADQLPAGVGQPGRLGRRAARTATVTVTARLTEVRRDLSQWT